MADNTWRSVSDSKPLLGDEVLIANGLIWTSAYVVDADPLLFNYGDECSETLNGKPVTHWMPGPELPGNTDGR